MALWTVRCTMRTTDGDTIPYSVSKNAETAFDAVASVMGHLRVDEMPDDPALERFTKGRPWGLNSIIVERAWDGPTDEDIEWAWDHNHIDYPHDSGYLMECPACERKCHCVGVQGVSECVWIGHRPSDG